nr:hypothetical protein GCM10020092_094390 [Actinoplanes digitatis]
MQRRDGRFITVRPGPVEQLVHMCFAGFEVSRTKALQVSGIHRPNIRAAIPTAELGRQQARYPEQVDSTVVRRHVN